MLALVIVAKNEDTLKKIAETVQAEDVRAITTRSLAELPEILREVPISGLLLDLVTSTKSTAQEKLDTNDLLQLYPHAKFKVVGTEVRILGESNSLQQFIRDCRSFTPRIIRRSKRFTQHIGALLSRDSTFSAAEKTVTINFSNGGCFMYSAGDWQVGERIWLRFIENDCVVQGTVRWIQPWGNNKKLPGIGIEFDFELINSA